MLDQYVGHRRSRSTANCDVGMALAFKSHPAYDELLPRDVLTSGVSVFLPVLIMSHGVDIVRLTITELLNCLGVYILSDLSD